jgi:hypothetical protein
MSLEANDGISIREILLENEDVLILSTTQSPTAFVQLTYDDQVSKKGIYMNIFVPIGIAIIFCLIVVSGYVVVVKWSYQRRKKEKDKKALVFEMNEDF